MTTRGDFLAGIQGQRPGLVNKARQQPAGFLSGGQPLPSGFGLGDPADVGLGQPPLLPGQGFPNGPPPNVAGPFFSSGPGQPGLPGTGFANGPPPNVAGPFFSSGPGQSPRIPLPGGGFPQDERLPGFGPRTTRDKPLPNPFAEALRAGTGSFSPTQIGAGGAGGAGGFSPFAESGGGSSQDDLLSALGIGAGGVGGIAALRQLFGGGSEEVRSAGEEPGGGGFGVRDISSALGKLNKIRELFGGGSSSGLGGLAGLGAGGASVGAGTAAGSGLIGGLGATGPLTTSAGGLVAASGGLSGGVGAAGGFGLGAGGATSGGALAGASGLPGASLAAGTATGAIPGLGFAGTAGATFGPLIAAALGTQALRAPGKATKAAQKAEIEQFAGPAFNIANAAGFNSGPSANPIQRPGISTSFASEELMKQAGVSLDNGAPMESLAKGLGIWHGDPNVQTAIRGQLAPMIALGKIFPEFNNLITQAERGGISQQQLAQIAKPLFEEWNLTTGNSAVERRIQQQQENIDSFQDLSLDEVTKKIKAGGLSALEISALEEIKAIGDEDFD